MDRVQTNSWKWVEVGCLVGGAVLHGALVLPSLAAGGGSSVMWLPLHMAPFAALFAQGQLLRRRVGTTPGPVSASGSIAAILTTILGASVYSSAASSHSLFAPLGFILAPLALIIAAPITRSVILGALRRRMDK